MSAEVIEKEVENMASSARRLAKMLPDEVSRTQWNILENIRKYLELYLQQVDEDEAT